MRKSLLAAVILIAMTPLAYGADKPKDSVDQATLDRAYQKLNQRKQSSPAQPAPSTSGEPDRPKTRLMKLADAASAELEVIRLDALTRFHASTNGQSIIVMVDAAQRKRDMADAAHATTHTVMAAQELLDAKKVLLKAESDFLAADPAVQEATANATAARAAADAQILEIRERMEKQRERIAITGVEKGMYVDNISMVLGNLETTTSYGEGEMSYQWVKYDGPQKEMSRIITVHSQDGVVTSVSDTKFKPN